jgi:hypothetical protein
MRNLRGASSVIIGCFLIAISNTSPSSAVLGLSKCEKMVKKVENQERITTALWNNFDRRRKQIDSPKSDKTSSSLLDRTGAEISRLVQLNKTLVGMALDINKSGLKTLSLMKAESSCFRADTYAKIINQTTTLESSVRDWDSAYRSKSNTQYDFKNVFPTKPSSFLRIFPVK